MKTVLIIAAAFVSTSFLFADIIHVPTDTSTIQGGIYLANEGDTVLVAEDTYFGNINFKGKAITVASQFIMDGDTSHISKTVIDGSKPSDPDNGSVVTFNSGEDTTSILCGFTITGGTGNKTYVSIHQSYEIHGGGVHLYESSAKIQDNIIIDNNINSASLVGAGGGIFAASFEPNARFLIVRKCQISFNTVTGRYAAGGGIVAARVNINYIIEDNIVSNNEVYCTSGWKAVGGGIGIDHALPTIGTMIIRNNIIKNNEVHGLKCFGGGLYVVLWEINETTYDHLPNPLIYNNIIVNNLSEWKGGAITVWVGKFPANTAPSENLDICPQPAFINNTIVNNLAAKGSGIYCYYSNFLLMNSILWNDLSMPESSEIDMGKSGSGNWDAFTNENKITFHNSIIGDGNWNNFNNRVFATDPLFVDSLYHLSENSPAIGMGRKSISIDGATFEAPAYDFDGNIRPNPIDTLVDVGVFESPHASNFFICPKSIDLLDEISYLNPATDYLRFTSDIYNPYNHNINVLARIVSLDNALKDSVELYDDGAHNDGEIGDLIFGGQLDPINEENEFRLSLGIKDNDNGRYTVFNDTKRITTIGPVDVTGFTLKEGFLTTKSLNLSLKNSSQTATANNITVELSTADTASVLRIDDLNTDPIDIPAQQSINIEKSHNIVFKPTTSDTVTFTVQIYSNNYHFWTHTEDVVTSLNHNNEQVLKTYSLSQNYPNPFNPITNIQFQIPSSQIVTLKIYNILGEEVVTLVDDKLRAGEHTYQFDGSNLSSGVYMYRIEAGEYSDVKKMILLR